MSIAVTALLVVACGGIAVTVRILDGAGKRAGPAAARGDTSWRSDTALIGDVEGDGVDDVIGLISYSREPSQYLAAFSGKDGHRLWESSLGADDTTKLALTVATIVRGDAAGTVYAYALSTGAERWHRPAGERVTQLCAGESPDEILLETADQRWLQVPLQLGLMTPLADRGHQPPDRDRVRDRVAVPRCDPLQRADLGAINGATILPDPPSKVDGMSIRHVLARGDGPRIAVGSRSPGTPVPMLAAFDAAGHVTWRIDVPASDTLRARWPSDDLVALTDGAVLLVYETNTEQPILVAIDRATGRRQWEIAPKKVSRMIGIAVSRTAIALSGSGLLQVFDVEHGRAMYMIGQ